MSQPDVITAKCAVCGRIIHENQSELVGSPWELSVCHTCGRERMLNDDSILVRRKDPIEGAKFDINDVYIKPGALHYLTESSQHCWPFVEDHARNSTPNAPDKSPQIERIPFLESAGHHVSQHKTAKGKRLWIMTDREGVTVVMAPGEY